MPPNGMKTTEICTYQPFPLPYGRRVFCGTKFIFQSAQMTLITKFFVPANEVADVGLKEICMPRLGRFVALAGKNGSGKSRILNKLEWFVSARLNGYDQLSQHRQTVINHEKAIKNSPVSEHMTNWKAQVKSSQYQIDMIVGRVVPDEDSGKFKAIRFVPKHLNLQDPRQHPNSLLTVRFAQAKVPGIANSETTCLFYVKQLQERWWNVEHPKFSGTQEEKQSAIEIYKNLQDIIQRLLREKLDRNIDGEPTLFGNPISDTNLSDGQRVILQLCVALHAQKSDFENTVFILDEPENHLHPSAAIDLLESLYQATGNSQIWIATHSVPLLAYVASIEPMALWFVEDGAVANSGRSPQKVLEGLLGSDERIGQLNTFTGLPAQLASIQYACESLLPPQVVIGGERDPQVSQIQKIVASLGNGSPTSVLDFGAGKGRLLDGLGASLADMGQSLPTLLDYFAFDQFPTDKDTCKAVIQTHFPGEATRYFSSTDDFFSHKDEGSIAVVVMCNVLHEISAHAWQNLFSGQSLISRALRDDGYLLIVEDQRIPVGEQAHEHGFMVLDTPHLRTLFSIKDVDVQAGLFLVDDKRNDGRLKAHLVAKSLLNRMTTESRKTSIEQLRNTAKEKIKELRSQASSYANGQLHGFWTQQFANTSLFLDEA